MVDILTMFPIFVQVPMYVCDDPEPPKQNEPPNKNEPPKKNGPPKQNLSFKKFIQAVKETFHVVFPSPRRRFAIGAGTIVGGLVGGAIGVSTLHDEIELEDYQRRRYNLFGESNPRKTFGEKLETTATIVTNMPLYIGGGCVCGFYGTVFYPVTILGGIYYLWKRKT